MRRNDNWKALQKPSQVVHPSICRLIKLPSKHISEYTEDERTLVSKTFKFLWKCYEDREALYYQNPWDGLTEQQQRQYLRLAADVPLPVYCVPGLNENGISTDSKNADPTVVPLSPLA